MPAGLSVNTGTGLISGTPTTAATSTVTLSATNAGGTGTALLTLTINNLGSPVITSSGTASGTVGSAFSYQITATNSPTSYAATNLPAGLSVNTGTGLISGTPTTAATSTVTLSATNAGGTGTATLTLTIKSISFFVQAVAGATSGTAQSLSLSFPQNTAAGDLILVAFDFDTNSTPSSVVDSQNNAFVEVGSQLTSPGGTRSRLYYAKNINGGADTVTITLSANSAWLELYLVEYSGVHIEDPVDAQAGASGSTGSVSSGNATTTAAYDVIVGYCVADWVCTAGSGFTARSTFHANLIEDMVSGNPGNYAATGSANNGWTMQMVALKLVMTNPAPPVITSSGTASGTVGSAFSYQITAANSPTSYGATNLPAGLSVNSGTGLISGTPTTAGTSTVTLSASNSSGTGMATLTVTIAAAGALTISPRTAALTFTRSQQFTTNGTSVTWLVDGVAGGSATSGTIGPSGLYTPPSSVGVHTVTVTAVPSQSANATVYITNYSGKFTHQNDNGRTGQNLNETVLTTSNVNSTQFGKLFSYALDGQAYASPLYVANVSVAGQGNHNVVYVATEHDSVYAFDADGLPPTQLWHVSFINPTAGINTISTTLYPTICCDINPEIGITSTPVIDPTTGTIYVVAQTAETSGSTTNFVTRLHALDITSGAEKFGGPVVVTATLQSPTEGLVEYADLTQNQRPGLLLSNGVVYIASGSHGDQYPWHGWLLGYSASTLQQVMVFCTTPNTPFGGGIWQSGAAPAVDAAGNIYFVTGNGTFDGATEWGDTIIKLSPGGVVLDYFTPWNQSSMNTENADLGAAGVILLPDQPTAPPQLAGLSGKSEAIYIINRNNMGGYNPNNDNQIVQELDDVFPNGSGDDAGNWIPPVYFNGNIYFSPVNDNVQIFALSNGLLSSSPTSRSSASYYFPGGGMAISANGSSNGILWSVQLVPSTPAVLHAYDPTDLTNELYNSNQAGTRDTMDLAVKYSIPAVANGKVFVGAKSSLVVYGLLP